MALSDVALVKAHGVRTSAALIVATLGCNAILGVDELSPHSDQDEQPRATDVPFAAQPCAACVERSCSDELRACDGGCAVAFACLAACDRRDSLCRRDCETDHAEAMNEAPALRLDRCVRVACTDACYGIGGLLDGMGSEECSSCFDVDCAGLTQWCLFSEGLEEGISAGSCEREWWCMRTPEAPDPAHRLACTDGYPHPESPRNTFDLCRETQCQRECAFGTDWGCVGRYRWPPPAADHVNYDIFVREGSKARMARHTLRGVQVAACESTDCEECDSPVAAGSSFANEVPATLERLPLGARGFEGCFHVVQERRPDLEPVLHAPSVHYFGRPITSHEGRVTIDLWPSFEDIARITTYTPDPARGIVLAVMHDCMGDRAKDVAFELPTGDDRTTRFYILFNPVPSLTAVATGVAGIGGFFDVAEGRHEVRAIADGRLVSSIEVDARAGWITQVWMYPTPAE